MGLEEALKKKMVLPIIKRLIVLIVNLYTSILLSSLLDDNFDLF